MKKAYIVVMDFCSGCIKTYEHDFPEGAQNEDVENWLEEKTDFYRVCLSEQHLLFFLLHRAYGLFWGKCPIFPPLRLSLNIP